MQTLKSRHIFKAIQSDDELRRLFRDCVIHEGGVKQTVTDFKFKTKLQQDKEEMDAKKSKMADVNPSMEA